MSPIRSIAFATFAALTLAAVALATFPATAEEDTTFTIDVAIDQTLPRVEGTVTVTDGNGNAVYPANVTVVSTIDLAPAAPAAKSSGATAPDGTFDFAFGYVSTGSVPGDHTLTVTVAFDGVTQVTQVAYTVPEL